jgi:transposase
LITPSNYRDLPAASELLPTVRPPRRLLADRAYDAHSLRKWLATRGVKAVIPPNPTRKHPHRYDKKVYQGRNLIERFVLPPQGLQAHRNTTSDAFLCRPSSWWIN